MTSNQDALCLAFPNSGLTNLIGTRVPIYCRYCGDKRIIFVSPMTRHYDGEYQVCGLCRSCHNAHKSSSTLPCVAFEDWMYMVQQAEELELVCHVQSG